VSSGDELLDYRATLAWFGDGARSRVAPGSDHAMYDFGAYVDDALEFLLSEG